MSARRGQKRRTGGGPKPAPPVSVQKLFQRAVAHHGAGRLNEAAALYAQVLALEPRHASSWTNLGIVFRTRGSFEGAVACYRRALELNPDDPGVLGNLGNVLKDLGRLEESLAAHRKAAAARPNDHSARYNYGIALKQAADLEGALAEFDAAHRLKPDASGPPWDRALALLQLGRFEEGWRAYESRWKLPDHPPRPYPFPQWQGEPFEGRTLLVHPEQGFGDAIIACRFLPQVKARGGTVVLECKPELLRRLLSELEGVDRIVPPGKPPEGVDLHCPVMSLAGLFDTTMDTLPPTPNLHIPEEARNRFRPVFARHADRFKVGIIWSGSVTLKATATGPLGSTAFCRWQKSPGCSFTACRRAHRRWSFANPGLRARSLSTSVVASAISPTPRRRSNNWMWSS